MTLSELTLAEASAQIRAGELSPVELTTAMLDRIDRLDGELQAWPTVLRDEALAAAREAEREVAAGTWRGPLHGIPIGVKDLLDVRGAPTLAGSQARQGHVADEDAAVIRSLRQAGSVILGKTATHELAYGATTPGTANPWDTTKVPGGSSGGSGVALAARTCLGALGTDTAGSIRIPAALCGVVGVKPTYGLVSRDGVVYLSWSLDHIGPLARTVEDAALVLDAIAGTQHAAGLDGGLDRLRVAVPTNVYWDPLAADVEHAVRDAIAVLAGQAAEVIEVTLPLAELVLPTGFGIVIPEASAYHRATLVDRADLYGPATRALLEAGLAMSAVDYLRALQAREAIAAAWRDALAGVDVLAAPTVPAVAVDRDQDVYVWPDGRSEAVLDLYVRTCAPANITGRPAVSVPCGQSADGLPIGLQLVGQPFDERTLLRAAHAFEQATEWHQHRPALAADAGGEG